MQHMDMTQEQHTGFHNRWLAHSKDAWMAAVDAIVRTCLLYTYSPSGRRLHVLDQVLLCLTWQQASVYFDHRMLRQHIEGHPRLNDGGRYRHTHLRKQAQQQQPQQQQVNVCSGLAT